MSGEPARGELFCCVVESVQHQHRAILHRGSVASCVLSVIPPVRLAHDHQPIPYNTPIFTFTLSLLIMTSLAISISAASSVNSTSSLSFHTASPAPSPGPFSSSKLGYTQGIGVVFRQHVMVGKVAG